MTKTQIKPAPKKTPAPKKKTATKAKVAAAPKVNPHMEAGVNINAYAGPSSMINANRKTRIMLVGERTTGSMTERMQKALYALRKAYAGKQFPAKGFDNGIMRDLAAAGLITLKGGAKETINGKPYLIDAATPVMVNITKAGQDYGKAA